MSLISGLPRYILYIFTSPSVENKEVCTFRETILVGYVFPGPNGWSCSSRDKSLPGILQNCKS